MSFFQKLIGQKQKKLTKEDKTKQVNDAIHKLKDHVILLNKRKECDAKRIAAHNSAAKQCLKNKNRKGALAKIKLRKQIEKRVECAENQIFNLEVQIMALDESLMNANMMDVMKIARDAIKIENAEVLINEAEENMEDIKEAMELQEELNNLLSSPLVDFDDDELENELAELDDEVRDNGLIYGRIDVDKKDQNANQDEEENEEDEIKKLEIEMNLASNDRINVQMVQAPNTV